MRAERLWAFPFTLTGALLSPFIAVELYAAVVVFEETRWISLRNALMALFFAAPMLWVAWRIAKSRAAMETPPRRSQTLTLLAYAALLAIQAAVMMGILSLID